MPTPPSWARRLAGMLLPAKDREAMLADLDELYARWTEKGGRAKAIARYLRQIPSLSIMGARQMAADRATSAVRRAGPSITRALSTDLLHDARQALRSLLRSPGFSTTAVGTLGLGLAGAITIFALIHGILIKPLNYHEPDRLVAIFTTDLGQRDRGPSAPANVIDWQRGNRTVEHMTAAHPWSATLLSQEPRKLIGLKATWPLFDLLGATPLLGRTWHDADSAGAEAHVVVLGHELWTREFGSDSSVVGTTIRLDGEPYMVLAVMPQDFAFPPFWATEAEFWVPLDFGVEPSRRAQFVRVFGRMRDGVGLADVATDFGRMNQRLTERYPDDLAGLGVNVEAINEPVVSGIRPALLGVFAATALLLLVATVNVANLMLAKALARDRERAVRQALGASRRRIVSQELWQSTLLGISAGLVGLGVAAVAIQWIASAAPLSLPRMTEIGLEPMVVLVSLTAATIIGLVLGLLAASRNPSGVAALRSGAGQTAGGAGRVRDIMVVAEVALAVVLLAGAGLTLRSLAAQLQIDTGVDPEGVLTLTIDLGGTSIFPSSGAELFTGNTEPLDRQLAFFRQLVERAGSLPGVTAAGITSHLPLSGDVWSTAVSRADRAPPPSEQRLTAVTRVISPGYLDAVGVTVVAGRQFSGWGDEGGDEILVSQSLAQTLWPGTDPVGQRLRTGSDLEDPMPVVVGVVSDVRQASLAEAPLPEIFRPYGRNPFPWNQQTSLAIRSLGQPEALSAQVQLLIRELEPAAPITDVRTLEGIIEDELFSAKLITLLVSVFAVFASLVSGLGLFGVIKHLVGQRRREFGIRLALGSSPKAVVNLVMRRGLALILGGLALGLVISMAAAGVVGSLLYQVHGRDPIALIGASLGLTLIGLLATWWPARSAGSVSPMESLRSE